MDDWTELDTIKLEDWTELEKKDLFKLTEQRVLPYEKPDNTWLSITFEMDLDRMDFSRSRYTAFDLLSNVGGLSFIFASVFAVFMAAWNYNALDNYMATRLFRFG